jgi:hypothetical protein
MGKSDGRRRFPSGGVVFVQKWRREQRPIDPDVWRIINTILAKELKARNLPPFNRG